MDGVLVDRARKDFLLFCELAGVEMFPWQVEFAGAVGEARHVIACCGRRAGKSFLGGALSVWWSIRERDQQTLIIGGTDDSSKRTLEQAAFICREHPWLGASVDTEQKTSITFSNGSRINAEPGRSEAAVRGYRRVDLEIWDESQLIPNGTYRAGRPAVGDRPQARVLAFGTPGGPHDAWYRTLFFRGLSDPGPYARSFTVPSTANPNVTQEELDGERAMWGDPFVDQEFLAQWQDEAGLVWTRDQLYGCVVDVEPFRVADAKRFSPWTEDWYGDRKRDRCFTAVAGLDFGKEVDAHSWVPIAALGDFGLNGDPRRFGHSHYVYWVPDFGLRSGTRYGAFVDEAMDVASGFGVQVLACEVTGVGAGPTEQIEDRAMRSPYRFQVDAVNASNRQRHDAVSRLTGLMCSGRLIIPAAHRDLIAQMSTFGKEVLPVSGLTRYEGVGGAHDDAVAALMMAVGCLTPQDRPLGRENAGNVVFGLEEGIAQFVTTPLGTKVPVNPRPEEYHMASWHPHPHRRQRGL